MCDADAGIAERQTWEQRTTPIVTNKIMKKCPLNFTAYKEHLSLAAEAREGLSE